MKRIRNNIYITILENNRHGTHAGFTPPTSRRTDINTVWELLISRANLISEIPTWMYLIDIPEVVGSNPQSDSVENNVEKKINIISLIKQSTTSLSLESYLGVLPNDTET